MDRQHPRRIERVRIALGNNLELKPDRPDGLRLVGCILGADLDQRLRSSTVALAAGLRSVARPLPRSYDQRKAFFFGIIVEPDPRKIGKGVIALHTKDMKPGRCNARDEVDIAGTQAAAKVGRAPREHPFQLNDTIIIAPPFAQGGMADQEIGLEGSVRRDLETKRLQPEIVRNGRSGDQPDRHSYNAQFHTASPSGCHEALLTKDHMSVQVVYRDTRPAAPRDRTGPAYLVLAAASIVVTLLVAQPAQAHDGTGLAGGFAAGVLHPLAGLDHMLAMISVGLWGAFLGRPLLYALPMLFPAAMAFGGALGMAGIGFPSVELGIAVSVVTLGAMILFAVRAPIWVACVIVGIFALFHGYAHGTELPSAADPVGYSAGFVLSTGVLHLLGIAAGLLRATRAGTIALRTAGGAIALTGAWFLVAAAGA